MKLALNKSTDEAARYREASTRASRATTESSETGPLFKEIVEELRRENKGLKAALETRTGEVESLKKTCNDFADTEGKMMFYKELSETRMKECARMAEEIICLRTDLDKSHSSFLKVQKVQSFAAKCEDEQVLGKKASSSLKKEKTKGGSAKKGVKWRDQIDDRSPKNKSPKQSS